VAHSGSKKNVRSSQTTRHANLTDTGIRNDRRHDEAYSLDIVNHFDNIEKLLNATYDLMKQEPTLDRTAFEHLRQLRVKVRYAIAAAVPAKPDELPKTAPLLWKDRDRSDKELSPLKFAFCVYSRWLHNNICRADIRRLDRQLYMAFYSYKITSEQLDVIGLPSRILLNTKKLAAAGQLKRPRQSLKILDVSPEEKERARLWTVARRRRQRALKR
jgi:hypothetical protein